MRRMNILASISFQILFALNSADAETQNATLPFTPEEGKVYSLSAEVNPSNASWFGLGFLGSSSDWSFASSNALAAPWMLMMADRSKAGTYAGVDINGGQNIYPVGADWSGIVQLVIRLDTREANWSVEWFINGVIGQKHIYETNPDIHYVGFARQGMSGGMVDNFDLSCR